MATTHVVDNDIEKELPREVMPFYETCREITGVYASAAAAIATYTASRRLASHIGGRRSQQSIADHYNVHPPMISRHWMDVDAATECETAPKRIDEAYWAQFRSVEYEPNGQPEHMDHRCELNYLVGERPETSAFWETICGTDDPREQIKILEEEFGLIPRHKDSNGDFSIQIASGSKDAYEKLIEALRE